ncbi:MAG: hypothetical protein HY904_03125 [Deltaproteobacteria bacterium]|nr:hypothetical protein [Deltaproteobacteria bacterium]
MQRLALLVVVASVANACTSGSVADGGTAAVDGGAAGASSGGGGATTSEGSTSSAASSGGAASGDPSSGTTVSSSSAASSRGPECSETLACTTGTCCTGTCANLATHFAHCSACDTPCEAREFCLDTACVAATLANSCVTGSALLLLDGYRPDDGTARAMGAALVSACHPAPLALLEGGTRDPAFVSPDTGLPVKRDERLIVTVGGPFVNAVVGAYEASGVAPLFFDRAADPTLRVLRVTATGDVALQVEDAAVTMCHDYFLLEVFRDPVDGRLVVAAYGLYEDGTRAAGVYFAQTLIPLLAVQQQEWLVVEWTDPLCDGPDATDTFARVSTSD